MRDSFFRAARSVASSSPAGGRAAEEGGGGEGLISRIGPRRPEDHRGVPEALHMRPVGEQVVQSGGVGEGGVLTGGGVQALLPAVGAEGGGVERHQGCAAGLGALHPLDGGMEPGDRPHLSGDETLHVGAVATAVIVVLPGYADGGVLLGETALHTEDQIGALSHLLQTVGQSGVLCRPRRLPL